jgi:uncharacterized protein YceH (UPF0502 family)
MDRDPPLVTALPRLPGTKEIRYAHLLSGEVDASVFLQPRSATEAADPAIVERLQQLEAEVAQLRQELIQLKEQLAPPSPETVTNRIEE